MSSEQLPPSAARIGPLFRIRRFLQNPIPFFLDNHQRYGATHRFRLKAGTANIMTIDPDAIMYVLRTNAQNYEKPPSAPSILSPFIGRGLLIAEGVYHSNQRRMVQHAFHRKAIMQMQEAMQVHMRTNLQHLAARKEIDLLAELRPMLFHGLTKAIFGDILGAEQAKRWCTDFIEVYGFFSKIVKRPALMPWFRLLGTNTRVMRKAEAMRAEVIVLVQRARSAQDLEQPDILNMLLSSTYEGSTEGMTDAQIAEECLTLLVAGHETASNALTWLTWLMGKNPDVATRLRFELAATQQPNACAYLDQVIDETLRLYPPSWTTDRLAQADDKILDMEVPAGSRVILFLYGLHHSAELWPDPERFDPERFAPAYKAGRHTYALLPFGAGPRMCIGRNLALMVIQTYASQLVQGFDIQLLTRQVGLKPVVTLQPDRPIKIRLRKV